MDVQRIDQGNRSRIDAFIVDHWFTREMVVHGECFDLGKAEGFYVEKDGAVTGLLTYRVFDGTMEILSLDSIHENQGIGTSLLNMAIFEAKALKCCRITVITTNDNLHALQCCDGRQLRHMDTVVPAVGTVPDEIILHGVPPKTSKGHLLTGGPLAVDCDQSILRMTSMPWIAARVEPFDQAT